MPTQIQGIEFEVVGSGADAAAKSLDKLADSLKKVKKATSSGLGTSGASNGIRALQTMLNQARDALTSVGKGALKAGKNILAMPFKSVADKVKGLNSKLGTLMSSLKRIAFYRVIRTIIKEIGQAFKEGIQNLYGWSALVGGEFKNSMDMISTSMLYFKNSVGAAVAPIINALAPAIDFLIDKIVALLNLINQLFARLTGAAYWTKAKKKADEYGDAVGGAGAAAKEAMHYLAPFDELNVLPDNKDRGGGGGGGATDFSDMFEEVTEFNEALKNFADQIKDAVNRGDWKGLGELLGGKVNEIIERIDFAGIGKKVGEKINAWFTTKYWTLETINFHAIGQSIATFLNNMLYEIDFDTLGRTITQPFTNIGNLIIGALETVDWGRVGSSIREFITGAFSQIGDFLDKYDWMEVGMKLFDGLNEFFSGLDPMSVLVGVVEFAGKLAAALVQIIQGFLLGNKTFIDDSGVEWKFDVNGRLVKVEDKVPKKDKTIKGLQGELDDLEDKLTEGDKTLDVDGKITKARDATHSATVISAVAEIIEAYDMTLRDPLVGAVAALQRWEKANGFDSTISDMTAEFIKWGVTAGFGRQIKDMVAVFSKWTKDNPQVFNQITDLVAKFKTWKKENGFPDTINGIIAGFTSWVKNNPQVFSQISGMIANLASWAKANGFSDVITGFTAALSSYLKQFDDPTIQALASIVGSVDFTEGENYVSAIANIIRANPALANDPVLQALAEVADVYVPPGTVVGIPAIADGDTDEPWVHVPGRGHDPSIWDEDEYARGGLLANGVWKSITRFANGGLARGSQLFWAREAGPELVGTLGSHTAVMNNDQIVASVSDGVARAISAIHFKVQGGESYEVEASSEETLYRAFRRALDETDFGGDIELDGDTLYSAMVNRNNRNTRMTGVNAFA